MTSQASEGSGAVGKAEMPSGGEKRARCEEDVHRDALDLAVFMRDMREQQS